MRSPPPTRPPPSLPQVLSVEDEEFCAIPMGGCLPVHPQRVIGVGGTAGMVHPSTGYMVSRVLGAAPLVADAIVDQLSSGECDGWCVVAARKRPHFQDAVAWEPVPGT